MKIIDIKGLTKKYGNYKVLNGIDLDILQGEFVAIMGPSGSGKTTLLNVMSTVDEGDGGSVIVDGTNLKKIKKNELAVFRRDKIGFIFQDFNLLDNMTIMDNIALPLVLNNIKLDTIMDKINSIAKMLGIYNKLNNYPYELSGGQKQRAAICRAVINSPKIIFADEPTGALDSKASYDVLECFRIINQKFNTTIVMVTHDATAASYCDRTMFLKDGVITGRLDSDGNPKNIYKKILNILSTMEGENSEFVQNGL